MTTDSNPNKEGHDMPACKHPEKRLRSILTGRSFTIRCMQCGSTPLKMRDDFGRFLPIADAMRGPEF